MKKDMLVEEKAELVIKKIEELEKKRAEEISKKEKKRKNNFRKWLLAGFLSVLTCLIVFFGVAFYKYNKDLSYRNEGAETVAFIVNSGESLDGVAKNLESSKLIISSKVFIFYAKLNNLDQILAGKYKLSAEMTIPEILKILNEGQKVDSFNVTFLPGGTVQVAKKTLLNLGYSSEEVDSAFEKDYSEEFPNLFKDKPTGTDLEGFLYGETHNFENGTSVEDILRRFLADFEEKVVELGLVSKFEKLGLSLYEGITLSSIVQKETLADYEDQRKVAGVFYNRIKQNMTLGSDVTYQYIADKLGLERTPFLDNPYNLRKYSGLTPTPISTPSISALKATANPANHEYLYFLSGDDDVTYYGKTEAEHEENIRKYCAKKCLIM